MSVSGPSEMMGEMKMMQSDWLSGKKPPKKGDNGQKAVIM